MPHNNMFSIEALKKNQLNILGIGNDICYIKRIQNLIDKFGDKIFIRILSPEERDYCHQLSPKKQTSFLAKRFSVKESVSKALGTGIGKNVFFKDISCLNKENKAPYITLTGITHITALALAKENNFSHYQIYTSLSDENHHALSFVIISGYNE